MRARVSDFGKEPCILCKVLSDIFSDLNISFNGMFLAFAVSLMRLAISWELYTKITFNFMQKIEITKIIELLLKFYKFSDILVNR